MNGADHDQQRQDSSDDRSSRGDVVRIDDYEVPAGIQVDLTDERVLERLEACLTHPLATTFVRALDALDGMTKGQPGSRVLLGLDFAPLRWVFTVILPDGRPWLHGGLIFYGSHDDHGNGSAPTFCVSVSGEDGWQLHT